MQALVRSMLEEDALHSGSERSSLHQDDHCYQESKRSKTDYALDLDDYADVDHDLDEISKYVGSNFSSMEYHAEGCIGGFDVIKFWHDQSSAFPKLSKLARQIFSIPCSSASSERVFSCAGRVYEERRNRLLPGSVDAITFLNSYL